MSLKGDDMAEFVGDKRGLNAEIDRFFVSLFRAAFSVASIISREKKVSLGEWFKRMLRDNNNNNKKLIN